MAKFVSSFAATAAALAISSLLFSFQQKTTPQPPLPPVPPARLDTVAPPKAPAPPRIGDFGDIYRELDRAAATLQRTLPDLKVPEPPLPPQVNADAIEQALQSVDWNKLEADINRNLESLKKTQVDIDKIDVATISREATAGLEKARTEINRHVQVDMKKMQAEMQDLKPRLEAEMKKAQSGLDKARDEVKAFEDLVNGLAADGLLNKSKYRIEHKENSLYINGQKQPEAVYNKYRSFLKMHQDLIIKKDEKGLQINKHQDTSERFD